MASKAQFRDLFIELIEPIRYLWSRDGIGNGKIQWYCHIYHMAGISFKQGGADVVESEQIGRWNGA